MASIDLRKDLECPVCLNIYRDPVHLKCGHNFCRGCIDHVLDTHKIFGFYSCPVCREKFMKRPTLQRNIALRNIAERFHSSRQDQKVVGVCCTYCIHYPVLAVKSCLMCDASLCDIHLRVHSKAPEHVLCPPTANLESRKCSVHKKILEYYCTEDSTCVCVACKQDGEHWGHRVETLDEASEKKRRRLRDDLQKLMAEMEEAEKKVQRLQERRSNTQGKVAGEKERVTALFRDLRRRLDDLEKRVLGDIARWAERSAMGYDEVTRQLEIKKEKLSRKMRHIEELCNMADPLTVLQEAATGDLCDTEEGDDEDRERHDEDRERHDEELHGGGDLDVAAISQKLHTELSDIMCRVNVCYYIQQTVDLLLDVNTAGNRLHISTDRKSASRSAYHNRLETPERFQDQYQVMSSRCFYSGQHYWEVDIGKAGRCRVGMCFPSMNKRQEIGDNIVSWCLYRAGNQYSVRHNNEMIRIPDGVPGDRVRIYLDYEGGQISFYALGDPIRHLHTFTTTTFTEPLHAAVWVWDGCVTISGGKQEM